MWSWRRTAEREVTGPPPVVARRREWADLAPVQRVIGEHPLIDPPGRFAGELASWQSPGLLAPLGHVVTPEEPSGVVEAVPVAPAPPVVPRDRPERGGGRLSAFVQRWTADPPATVDAIVVDLEDDTPARDAAAGTELPDAGAPALVS